MLFLLNDRVLDIDPEQCAPPLDTDRLRALSLTFVTKLGQEIYAETPLLQRSEPERARRLAMLIASKAPEVNAALFAAPGRGCRPDEVAARLAAVCVEVMAGLHARDQRGELTPVAADREVWRRMAA